MAELLREAVAADCETLAAIDAQTNPSPWSAQAFRETLARACGFVARSDDGGIDGFVIFSVAADECEILDLAVRGARRRRGLGGALLDAALARAVERGARRCHLEVRASNVAARALYGARGFGVDGRRKDYYRGGAGGREDALLLSRDLDGVQP